MLKCVCVSLVPTTDRVDAYDWYYNRPSFVMCIRPFLALNVEVMAHVNQSDYVQVRPQAMSFTTLFSRIVAQMDCVLVAACMYKKTFDDNARSNHMIILCVRMGTPTTHQNKNTHPKWFTGAKNETLQYSLRCPYVCKFANHSTNHFIMCVNLFEFLVFLSLVSLFKANTLAGNNLVFAGCSACIHLVGLFKLKTRRGIHPFCL